MPPSGRIRIGGAGARSAEKHHRSITSEASREAASSQYLDSIVFWYDDTGFELLGKPSNFDRGPRMSEIFKPGCPVFDKLHAMEARISLITLGVEDLDRSVAFYRDGLGLAQREGPSGIAFFEMPGTWLSLYPRENLAEDANFEPNGSGFRGFTLAHNVRTREEVDQVIAEAASAGARIQKQPVEASWGGYSGYFLDPDGFLWEVAWNPHFSIE
jgi:catechol 2,3-dioxygenase-like lactoylglutathione lyase family enzyme